MKKFFLELKRLWLKFAHALGWFNTRLLLGVTYFTIIAIPSLIVLLLRKDLLHKRMAKNSATYWEEKPKQSHTPENASRQF